MQNDVGCYKSGVLRRPLMRRVVSSYSIEVRKHVVKILMSGWTLRNEQKLILFQVICLLLTEPKSIRSRDGVKICGAANSARTGQQGGKLLRCHKGRLVWQWRLVRLSNQEQGCSGHAGHNCCDDANQEMPATSFLEHGPTIAPVHKFLLETTTAQLFPGSTLSDAQFDSSGLVSPNGRRGLFALLQQRG